MGSSGLVRTSILATDVSSNGSDVRDFRFVFEPVADVVVDVDGRWERVEKHGKQSFRNVGDDSLLVFVEDGCRCR